LNREEAKKPRKNKCRGLTQKLKLYCMIAGSAVYLKADVQTALEVLLIEDWQKQQPLLLYFQGSDSTQGGAMLL
jgi:hypothetical protein